MDSTELDVLIDRAIGPVPAPAGLERALVEIPAKTPQQRRQPWLAPFGAGPFFAWSGGAAVLASALVLGLLTGAGDLGGGWMAGAQELARDAGADEAAIPSLDDLLLGLDIDDGDAS